MGHNWGMKTFAFIVLGLVMAVGGRGVFGEEATTATSAPATQGAGVVIDSPREWQVVQRGSDEEGVVRVAGKVEHAAGKKLNYWVLVGGLAHSRAAKQQAAREVSERAEQEVKQSAGREYSPNGGFGGPGPGNNLVPNSTFDPMPFTFPSPVSDTDGTFHVDLKLPAGGWYSVEVATVDEKGATLESATVQHVGVGEVFVTGGQSNSTNWGEARTRTDTGMVTVFDGKEWTVAADPIPGVDAGQGKGSPWCLFGDDMYAKLHVPIAIVPVGKGSTSVRQWLPKGDVVEIEPTKTYGMKKNSDGKWESEGTLYDRMVERMKQLGPKGFRAMLWHQGESDAHQSAGHTLPGKDYRAMLERVIKESRKEVGWEVPWFVAVATWGSPQSPTDADIREAQHGVVEDGVALQGPDTDTLIGANRQKDGTGVHMSLKGLYAHAALWANIVGSWVQVTAAK